MGGVAVDDKWGWNQYANCYVWYTYYDTSAASESDIMSCRLENKDDILITPDQVPLNKMRYEFMNDATKNTIRQLLTAEALMTVALIRGYASGVVKIPSAEMQLDYSQLMSLGQSMKEKTFEELKIRLEAMLPWNVMKNYSDMTDSLMNIKKKTPLGLYVI
jgi:hypothetical protein